MVAGSVAFSEALLNIRSQRCGFIYKNRFLKDKLVQYNANRLFDGVVVWVFFSVLVCFIRVKADSFTFGKLTHKCFILCEKLN